MVHAPYEIVIIDFTEIYKFIFKSLSEEIYLHFCQKGVETAARNHQRDILTNVVESLIQIYSKIYHGYSYMTMHLRIRPKLRNIGLKIMYEYLLVVTIGRQSAKTLIHSIKNYGQLEGMVSTRRHHNLESLKQALVKAMDNFPMEVVRKII